MQTVKCHTNWEALLFTPVLYYTPHTGLVDLFLKIKWEICANFGPNLDPSMDVAAWWARVDTVGSR